MTKKMKIGGWLACGLVLLALGGTYGCTKETTTAKTDTTKVDSIKVDTLKVRLVKDDSLKDTTKKSK